MTPNKDKYEEVSVYVLKSDPHKYYVGDFFKDALKRNEAKKIGTIIVTGKFKELDAGRMSPYSAEELKEFLTGEIESAKNIISKERPLLEKLMKG